MICIWKNPNLQNGLLGVSIKMEVGSRSKVICQYPPGDSRLFLAVEFKSALTQKILTFFSDQTAFIHQYIHLNFICQNV